MDTESYTRPIRVNLNLSVDIVSRAIQQVFSSDAVQFVASPDEADLIVFDDVRKVEKGFNKEKSYAYLFGMQRREKKPALPMNVSTIPITEAVAKLITIVSDLSKKLRPIDGHPDFKLE
ncbi:MAG: hypothetical protein Q8L47_05165 [bacterium]|nr:hypothetical protein [bacterium]